MALSLTWLCMAPEGDTPHRPGTFQESATTSASAGPATKKVRGHADAAATANSSDHTNDQGMRSLFRFLADENACHTALPSILAASQQVPVLLVTLPHCRGVRQGLDGTLTWDTRYGRVETYQLLYKYGPALALTLQKAGGCLSVVLALAKTYLLKVPGASFGDTARLLLFHASGQNQCQAATTDFYSRGGPVYTSERYVFDELAIPLPDFTVAPITQDLPTFHDVLKWIHFRLGDQAKFDLPGALKQSQPLEQASEDLVRALAAAGAAQGAFTRFSEIMSDKANELRSAVHKSPLWAETIPPVGLLDMNRQVLQDEAVRWEQAVNCVRTKLAESALAHPSCQLMLQSEKFHAAAFKADPDRDRMFLHNPPLSLQYVISAISTALFVNNSPSSSSLAFAFVVLCSERCPCWLNVDNVLCHHLSHSVAFAFGAGHALMGLPQDAMEVQEGPLYRRIFDNQTTRAPMPSKATVEAAQKLEREGLQPRCNYTKAFYGGHFKLPRPGSVCPSHPMLLVDPPADVNIKQAGVFQCPVCRFSVLMVSGQWHWQSKEHDQKDEPLRLCLHCSSLEEREYVLPIYRRTEEQSERVLNPARLTTVQPPDDVTRFVTMPPLDPRETEPQIQPPPEKDSLHRVPQRPPRANWMDEVSLRSVVEKLYSVSHRLAAAMPLHDLWGRLETAGFVRAVAALHENLRLWGLLELAVRLYPGLVQLDGQKLEADRFQAAEEPELSSNAITISKAKESYGLHAAIRPWGQASTLAQASVLAHLESANVALNVALQPVEQRRSATHWLGCDVGEELKFKNLLFTTDPSRVIVLAYCRPTHNGYNTSILLQLLYPALMRCMAGWESATGRTAHVTFAHSGAASRGNITWLAGWKMRESGLQRRSMEGLLLLLPPVRNVQERYTTPPVEYAFAPISLNEEPPYRDIDVPLQAPLTMLQVVDWIFTQASRGGNSASAAAAATSSTLAPFDLSAVSALCASLDPTCVIVERVTRCLTLLGIVELLSKQLYERVLKSMSESAAEQLEQAKKLFQDMVDQHPVLEELDMKWAMPLLPALEQFARGEAAGQNRTSGVARSTEEAVAGASRSRRGRKRGAEEEAGDGKTGGNASATAVSTSTRRSGKWKASKAGAAGTGSSSGSV